MKDNSLLEAEQESYRKEYLDFGEDNDRSHKPAPSSGKKWKEKEKTKKRGKNCWRDFLKKVKRLPPPFAIIDHIMFLVKRSLTNSYDEFLAEYFEEIEAA